MYHLPIVDRSTMGKWNHKVSFTHSRHEWCNLTNFYRALFFINVTIRECNFAMGTILGKGFAQALVHTSQHLCLRHLCCDLYALVLVLNPFPRLSPWRNQTFQCLWYLEYITLCSGSIECCSLFVNLHYLCMCFFAHAIIAHHR